MAVGETRPAGTTRYIVKTRYIVETRYIASLHHPPHHPPHHPQKSVASPANTIPCCQEIHCLKSFVNTNRRLRGFLSKTIFRSLETKFRLNGSNDKKMFDKVGEHILNAFQSILLSLTILFMTVLLTTKTYNQIYVTGEYFYIFTATYSNNLVDFHPRI